MEILLKPNIAFYKFDTQHEMSEKIMDFICNSKTDKILYKGNPNEVNYKLLKKILPLDKVVFDNNKKSIYKFVDISTEKNIRDIYQDFLTKVDCEYCLIYKF